MLNNYTFTAIVTSHNNLDGLNSIIEQLENQTLPPDEILVYVSDSGVPDIDGVSFYEVENMNDWGHEKRSMGVNEAMSDYLGFFNDDDEYSFDYIEEMMKYAGKYDLVACDWTSHLFNGKRRSPHPTVGSITSGNFIVRTDIARDTGYNHRTYDADGKFIVDVMGKGATWVRVPQLLYNHR